MSKLEILVSVVLTSLLLSMAARADSQAINYQAYLTGPDGAPVDSSVTLQLDAYNTDVGGTPLWTQNQTVEADNGLLTVVMGNPANPFPSDLFDTSVYIGITVNGEELLPRRPLMSSAFSFKAANSEQLGGLPASTFDQSEDVQDLQSQTLDQDDRLNAIESSAGDITEIIAGDGLSGGGLVGSATLSLATGGVTAANMSFNAVSGGAIQAGAVNSIKIQDGTVALIDLAGNSVDSSKILDGSVTSADVANGAISEEHINPQSGFTLGALIVQTNSTVFGDVAVGGRATISDNINVGSNAVIGGNTTVTGSIATGLNIDAGNDITAGGDASVAGGLVVGESITVGNDVNVAGSLGIGYVRVQKALSTTGPQYFCNDLKDKCKVYSAVVNCPSGYLAIGGGIQMTPSDRAKVLSSRPGDSNPGAWICEAQDELNEPVNDTCHAVCLRMTGL